MSNSIRREFDDPGRHPVPANMDIAVAFSWGLAFGQEWTLSWRCRALPQATVSLAFGQEWGLPWCFPGPSPLARALAHRAGVTRFGVSNTDRPLGFGEQLVEHASVEVAHRGAGVVVLLGHSQPQARLAWVV